MSASDDGLRDRIDAADEFRLHACQDYDSKLATLPATGAQAQEIERLRTVCDDAKIRFDRVKAGGQFVESVDEALALLAPGASVTVAGNTAPWTVSSLHRIPEADNAILVVFDEFVEQMAVPLSRIVSVGYSASR
jgi:hypothetical protein